ncbi:hypothetical protein NQ314_017541 [Rhamnusium bicolor]|uniref:Retrotransposon gag domain-containing protein n=1 Tax=Rhamnusium bicolor TaxID=1586634 RepID=A0AAV8WU94_9CUCU|nr:hypothetical protein NQ314_017541 [Rhamnusium bicolor]
MNLPLMPMQLRSQTRAASPRGPSPRAPRSPTSTSVSSPLFLMYIPLAGPVQGGTEPEATHDWRIRCRTNRRHGAHERGTMEGSGLLRTNSAPEIKGSMTQELPPQHMAIQKEAPLLGLGDARTQWRPLTQTVSEAHTTALTTLLEATRLISPQIQSLPNPRGPAQPDFSYGGTDEENPCEYLDRLRTYFAENRVPEASYLAVAKSTLHGPAKNWFDALNKTTINFEFFTNRFLNHFNSTAVVSQATMRLYGEKQKTNEESWLFIMRKVNLFRRLAPHTTEEQQTSIIYEQLAPQLRAHTRTAPPRSIQQLIEVTSNVEKDLGELTHPRTSSSTTTSATSTSRRPQAATNAAGSSAARPPYPCRHCGGEHYNNDCPNWRRASATNGNNPGVSSTSHQDQGNAARAGTLDNVRPTSQ